MAFHRDHVSRFLVAAKVPAHEGERIKQRAEAAIAEFGHDNKSLFSGGKLDEVIGDPELVGKFNEMWERGYLRR